MPESLQERWGALMSESINDTFMGRTIHSPAWYKRHTDLCREFTSSGYRYVERAHGWIKSESHPCGWVKEA